MHIIKKRIISIISKPIRLRLQSLDRDYVFRRAMRRFLKDPEEAITNKRTIADLIYGWGNEDWSAMEEYISACLTHTSASPGAILECGSGLTTILTGALAERSGRSVWTLEHNRAWAEKVARYLKQYNICSVRLCLTSLKNHGQFSWYTPPLESMLCKFDLVICDGPPGDTPGGRYGLLPVMKERLTSDAVILLDDAARDGEKAVAARWSGEFGVDYTLRGAAKPYFEIGMPNHGAKR